MRSFSQTLHFLKMRRLRHHRGGILPSGPQNWPLIAQEPTWGPWISSYTVVLALLPIQEKSKKASLYNELSASDFLPFAPKFLPLPLRCPSLCEQEYKYRWNIPKSEMCPNLKLSEHQHDGAGGKSHTHLTSYDGSQSNAGASPPG